MDEARIDSVDDKLRDTRRAFDGVAADYDGPTGNNEIIQRWRQVVRRVVTAAVPAGSRLLDLGCGTGLDLAYFAARGHDVLGIDWSPAMVDRTRARIAADGLGERARAEVVGIHELERLGDTRFAGIYSNFGPLNCVPDLRRVSCECARMLPDDGPLVVSVVGRRCPWEVLYYAAHADPKNALRRLHRGAIPVGLRGEVIWTRYFSPAELAREFAPEFSVVSCRALGLFVPPPYLLRVYTMMARVAPALDWLDNHLGSLPGLRNLGDHFVMVLAKRGDGKLGERGSEPSPMVER